MATDASGLPRERETLRDWLVVIASTVALVASVAHVYSIGMFIVPLEREFGWSRGEITAGLAVISFVSVVLAPLVGFAVDRLGSRTIGLPGLAIYCAAVMLLSTATGSIWLWWGLWALIALGTVMIKPTVWVTAIASRFETRRGLAIAIALCGTSIGSTIFPTIAGQLLAVVTWRTAYVILGGLAALVSLPMVFLFFFNDDRRNSRRDAKARSSIPGLSIGQGFRSASFVKLAIVSLIVTMATLSLAVHFVPIMQSAGFSAPQAGIIAGAIGIGSIIGRIGTGLLLDRFHGPYIGAFSYCLPIIGLILLLNFGGSMTVGFSIAFITGLALGAEIDVSAYLAARYFGMRNYGILFGSVAGVISLGAGTGPAITGLMYDYFGSYDQVFILLIPIFAISAVIVATMGRYPSFPPGESGSPEPA